MVKKQSHHIHSKNEHFISILPTSSHHIITLIFWNIEPHRRQCILHNVTQCDVIRRWVCSLDTTENQNYIIQYVHVYEKELVYVTLNNFQCVLLPSFGQTNIFFKFYIFTCENRIHLVRTHHKNVPWSKANSLCFPFSDETPIFPSPTNFLLSEPRCFFFFFCFLMVSYETKIPIHKRGSCVRTEQWPVMCIKMYVYGIILGAVKYV